MDDTRLTPLLADYAKTHDRDVMAMLVEGYLPLCKAVARRFRGQGVETEDLEQVAAIALMKAIERFEPERGFKFTTFAMPTIAGDPPVPAAQGGGSADPAATKRAFPEGDRRCDAGHAG